MKYTREIAEEVLKDYTNFHTSVWGDYEEEFLNSKFKKLLPEKGLLIHSDSKDLIVFRTGEKSGYGFGSFGAWKNIDNWSFVADPKMWREATEEDEDRWSELLKEECTKRGFENGTPFICLDTGLAMTFNSEDISWLDLSQVLASDFSWVMSEGEWAEPIVEDQEDVLVSILELKQKVERYQLEKHDLEYLKEYRRGFIDGLKQKDGRK